jgi:hypothetical protein
MEPNCNGGIYFPTKATSEQTGTKDLPTKFFISGAQTGILMSNEIAVEETEKERCGY